MPTTTHIQTSQHGATLTTRISEFDARTGESRDVMVITRPGALADGALDVRRRSARSRK